MQQYISGHEKVTKADGTELQIQLREFLWQPEKVRFLLGEENFSQMRIIAGKLKERIGVHFIEVRNIIINFKPPNEEGIFKKTLFKLYAEKLFEIRFAYMSWEGRYDYSVYLIQTECGKEKIEVAVVNKSMKNYDQKNDSTNKAVMFCLPNGAYLQYFVLESQYIDIYLNMGYKIVLWNYRGYGQSTG